MDSLKESKFLLLLFTDPKLNWEWPLYEAGFFSGLRETEPDWKRVTCLYEKDGQPPGPVKDCQNIPAEQKQIECFLKELYLGTSELGIKNALVPRFGEHENYIELVEQAKEIVNLINRKGIETTRVGERIFLELSDIFKDIKDETSLPKSLPDNALILDNDKSLLKLFNKNIEKCEWSSIKRVAEELDDSWIKELIIALFRIYKYEGHDAPQYVFISRRTGLSYYATPIKQEKLSSDHYRYTILFMQDRRGLNKPITSFSELMTDLSKLIEISGDEPIQMVCYTPAIGFLAQPKDEWNALKSAIEKKSKNISIACLEELPLKEWHDNFIGRYTLERSIISNEMTRNATTVSEELLSKIQKDSIIKRKPFDELPEYYLFASTSRVIIVTPLFLPKLREEIVSPEQRKYLHSVDMFGLLSNKPEVLTKANETLKKYF